MSIFFIADTHFNHQNIIDYENRPFTDVAEMNQQLIINWNKVVKPQDEIFVLGDFSFSGQDFITSVCRQLNGAKYLVQGNHDRRQPAYYRDCGFKDSFKYPIIYKDYFMLSHSPLYVNTNMPYANIYGHVHGSPIYKDYTVNSFCVSVERINYTPISFEVMTEKMNSLNNTEGN